LKVLAVATKTPWPPVDGGRLLLLQTLEGLAAAGAQTTLVAPVDPARDDPARTAAALAHCCEPCLVAAAPAGAVTTLARSAGGRGPLSIARHTLPAVGREVARRLAAESFDVVHAEQLQALPQAAPARGLGVPVVLRAQNVESDLWAAAARWRGGLRGRLLAVEARRLARWEGGAVRRAAATLALTEEDAARLTALAGGAGHVTVVRAPFPAFQTPPATGPRLSGDPAVVVLGSGGWLPNADSAAWFAAAVWPAVVRALPGAVLHLFGGPGASTASVVVHPAPADSAAAFAPGAVLAVPLRLASGVRMKVLEAWARGVPVVATPAAVAGLGVEDGREALLAADPPGFARAFARLHGDPALAVRLTAAGERARRERHDPARVTADLLAAYARAVSTARSSR